MDSTLLHGTPRIAALRALAAEAPLKIRIRGDCMIPVVDHDSLVDVTPASTYQPGDVIIFRDHTRNALVMHRLIGRYRRHGTIAYLTQADRARHPDRPIDTAQIIGRVPLTVSRRQRLTARRRFYQYALRTLWRRLRRTS